MQTGTINDISINTLTTSSAEVIAANQDRRYLKIHNPSAEYKIAFAPVGTDAAINGYGSMTLLPGASETFEGSKVPCEGAFNAISENASATGLTVWEA